ncbi:hypothetical protein GCM10010174_45670 [Kutzneria viridogrisea]|uniref:DUF3558 domain-containing protein n=1 Tax=Kutzneria viridogrisea TaxID=47990 RepID=A0ABR6BTF6_9PSEU|nr:hypothetical protein [Kutzneria viridogrisea]
MTSALRRVSAVVTCGLAAMLLGACSQRTHGDPAPTTTAATSTTSGAPKVSNPKNLKAHDACQLLTLSQLQALGAPATGKERQSTWGEKSCVWGNDEVNIGFSPDTTHGTGLSAVYANMSGSENFLPMTIAGYPAARTAKQTISCTLWTAPSDTQVFLVDLSVLGAKRANHEDPCALAQKVAEDVLSNLSVGQ